MTTSNIPQHIQEKANAMISKGTKMTFEAICEMYMKSESKSAKKSDSAKWQSRKVVSEMKIEGNASNWLAAKNLENAKNNLPSSMR